MYQYEYSKFRYPVNLYGTSQRHQAYIWRLLPCLSSLKSLLQSLVCHAASLHTEHQAEAKTSKRNVAMPAVSLQTVSLLVLSVRVCNTILFISLCAFIWQFLYCARVLVFQLTTSYVFPTPGVALVFNPSPPGLLCCCTTASNGYSLQSCSAAAISPWPVYLVVVM